MLEFAIFAVTLVVALVIAVFYLYPGGASKVSTVPGMTPSDAKEGNYPDIIMAGGFSNFLIQLHQKYGSVASFWYGTQYMVSISTPELFKQINHVFDRAGVIFEAFSPLIGKQSIQLVNGAEGQTRLKVYNRHFSHGACKTYYDVFQEVATELSKKWDTLPQAQHIPLVQYTMALAMKAIGKAAYGAYFEDKKLLDFRRHYDSILNELEIQQAGSAAVPGSLRDKKLTEEVNIVKTMIAELLEHRIKNRGDNYEEIFTDVLIGEEMSEEIKVDDAITFIVAGTHTTAYMLAWAIYFLATHKHVEKKLQAELDEVLGDGPVTPENINELKYTRQVLNETLRTISMAFYASRILDVEIELGGHIIPKQIPIILALGVAMKDEKCWLNPKRFNPDRFSPENIKTVPDLAYKPFGFAGKRMCPGYRFAYTEGTVVLAEVCRKFNISLAAEQVVIPVYGIVTKPEDEIWVTVEKRK